MSLLSPRPIELRTKVRPLESGDRLTRAEFERRYDAMPNLKKAELLERMVLVGSPVRFVQHGNPHLTLATWIGLYIAKTPGVSGGYHPTVSLDDQNEPQPDLLLRLEPAAGGKSRVDDNASGWTWSCKKPGLRGSMDFGRGAA